MLVADSLERLQLAVNEWTEELQLWGLLIYAAKSKVVCVGCLDEDTRITCSAEIHECIGSYCYLGTIICKDEEVMSILVESQ